MCALLADFMVMVTCLVHVCARMMYLLTISEPQLHDTAMRLAAAECTFADHDHDHKGLEFGCDQHAVDRQSSSPGSISRGAWAQRHQNLIVKSNSVSRLIIADASPFS